MDSLGVPYRTRSQHRNAQYWHLYSAVGQLVGQESHGARGPPTVYVIYLLTRRRPLRCPALSADIDSQHRRDFLYSRLGVAFTSSTYTIPE